MRLNMKITQNSMFYLLVIITPLIDTLNGAYVLARGGTGVSIGTFYRLFIILFCVFIFTKNRIKKTQLIWLMLTLYFPVNCLVRYSMYNVSFMSAFSYGIKWVFPVILIICFYLLQDKSKDRICIRIMDCWRYLIPGLLIVEYVLGIGEKTYWDAGFRGLYYSINDVGFSLTIMMTYSLYKLIILKVNKKNIIAVGLNFIAIIILAVKSCVLFAIIGGMYFFLIKYRKSFYKALVYTFVVGILIVIGVILMQEKIFEMVDRYVRFYNEISIDVGLFSKIMNFLTSARTPRISMSIDELSSQISFDKILFGWKAPYFEGAIEMDWFDSFFQHGIIGLAILFGYCYSFFFKNINYKKPWLYMLIIAMICSFFSGHVLNGALSSTVLAVVAQCAFSSKKSGKLKEIDLCEHKIETVTLKKC